MSKAISLILAAALCVLLLTGMSAPTYGETALKIENPYASSITQQQGDLRGSLDEPLTQLYDLVKASLFEMTPEIDVRRLAYSEDDLWRVILSIMYDSPEIFWVDWSNWQVRSTGNGFVLSPTYIIESTGLDTKRAELDGALAAFVSSASSDGIVSASDYEKVLYAHDYLVCNVVYDEEYLSYPEGTMMNMHTAYGALVEGKAVCDGYAHAYSLLLRELSVESRYVEGYTADGGPDEGHAWNLVSVDGAWYNVDATWDDVEVEDVDTPLDGALSHLYFLLSDAELAVDHTVDTIIDVPKSETGYGYFGKLGLSGNDLAAIEDAVVSAAADAVERGCWLVEFVLVDRAGYDELLESEFALGDVLSSVNDELESRGDEARVDDSSYRLVVNEPRGAVSFIMFEPQDDD